LPRGFCGGIPHDDGGDGGDRSDGGDEERSSINFLARWGNFNIPGGATEPVRVKGEKDGKFLIYRCQRAMD